MNFVSRDLLKRQEAKGGQPALAAYQDGAGIWTIGFGHTRNVHQGMICTQEQAESWLNDDLRGVEHDIADNVTQKLSQGQYDALVIWDFNTGALLTSPTLLKLINAGRMDDAVLLMQRYRYITADGKKVVSTGLMRRRAIEAALWNAHSEGDQPISTGEIPESPPEKVTQTTTGKLSLAGLASSVGGAITLGMNAVQPVTDAVKGVQTTLGGFSGYVAVAIGTLLGLSILFNIALLAHKSSTITEGT